MRAKTIFNILSRAVLGVFFGAALGFFAGTHSTQLSAENVPFIMLAQEQRIHPNLSNAHTVVKAEDSLSRYLMKKRGEFKL